jgi:gas vesicle protein
MEVFIGLIVIMGVGWVLFCVLLGASLNKAKSEHEKEKAQKLAMLKEHPELAKEIWQSIEDQETRYHTKMKNLNDALQKAGTDFQKAVTPAPPKPKSHNGAAMVKLGLGIANRLIK